MPGLGLFAGFLCLGAAALPPFAEVWQREVIEGRIDVAASDYERIYMSPPSESLRLEIRQKAALRAGICFERLGRARNARRALETVLELETQKPGLGGDFLVTEARLRLDRLELEVSSPGGNSEKRAPSRAADPAVDAALQRALANLDAGETRQKAVLEALAGAEASCRQDLAEREEYLEQLSAIGVIVSFAEDSMRRSLQEEGFLTAPERLLADSAIAHRVRSALAQRFSERALLSLAAGNRLEASRSLLLLTAVAGAARSRVASDSTLAARVQSFFEASLAPPELSARIRQFLVDRETDERVSVWEALHDLLESAAVTERSGRRDKAVEYLDEIRGQLDWVNPAPRAAPEIRSISSQIARRYLLFARDLLDKANFVEKWSRARRQAEEIVVRSEELATLLVKVASRRGPALLGDGAGPVSVCRQEAERLLAAAREAQGRSGSAAARKLARQGLLLLEWVPQSDPESRCRQALEALARTGLEAIPPKTDTR